MTTPSKIAKIIDGAVARYGSIYPAKAREIAQWQGTMMEIKATIGLTLFVLDHTRIKYDLSHYADYLFSMSIDIQYQDIDDWPVKPAAADTVSEFIAGRSLYIVKEQKKNEKAARDAAEYFTDDYPVTRGELITAFELPVALAEWILNHE